MPDAPAAPTGSAAAAPVPAPGARASGLIEAFYGPPWSWDARVDVMAWCHRRGMTHYIYAPKDDALHRERWRELYGPEEISGFEQLVAADTLEVGFGISPGLSIDYGSGEDRDALGAKVDQVLGLGIRMIALLDDLPIRPGLGRDHVELTTWLRGHIGDRGTLVMTPTEYTGTRSTPYLDALAAGVPIDVPIGWTGPTVVCDQITLADIEERSASLGGRAPLLWDNYPVNDVAMADRLFVGPIRGREPGLADVCSGYFANPMVQPMASKPALASIAALVRGEDPEEAWAQDIGPLRTFAEACDGEHPRQLVDRVLDRHDHDGLDGLDALGELEAWLRTARTCDAPGLEDEAGPWVGQVHAEARLGLLAVKLLRAKATGAPEARIGESSMGAAASWPGVWRGPVSVMGPRCSFRPVIGQDAEGEWSYRDEALTLEQNAIDRLVRVALER